MRLFIILSVLSFSIQCFSQEQNNEIDSLKNILLTLKNDSNKVNTLNEMGMISLDNNIIAAIQYGSQANSLAKAIDYKKGQGNAQKLLGIASINQGNVPQATVQFMEALAIFESLNDKVGMSSMLNNLGNLSSHIGDNTKAIDYHLKSLKIAEELNNNLRLGTSLLSLGLDYSAQPDGEEAAIGYYRRALPIFEEINYEDGIATVSINIGEIYYKKGMNDSALVYLNTAIKILKGSKDAAMPLTYLADIYAARNNFDSAYYLHNQAIEVSEKLGAQLYLAQSLLGLAKTQQKQGTLTKSIETYRKALELSQGINAKPEIKQSYQALADGYAAAGDYKNAYLFRSKLTLIKDTLFNIDEAKKIQQMQFNFNIDKKETEIALQDVTIKRQKMVNYATGISGFLFLIVAVGSYNRYKYVKKTNKIIKDERDKSQELLLNILPEETARELESNGHAKTRFYDNVTVLFTDFKGFSTIAGKLTPIELVSELNDYFMAFDEIMGKYNLEKIKTIGDAYMCAGGIPTANTTHPLDAVQAALAMQAYMEKRQKENEITGVQGWELRIGIHTGPVVAGVVGKRKYAYDIWGDTVNIASRMESNGEPGEVNISESTYQQIKEHYQCLYRGKISAKNIGEVDMYFIESKISMPKPKLSQSKLNA